MIVRLFLLLVLGAFGSQVAIGQDDAPVDGAMSEADARFEEAMIEPEAKPVETPSAPLPQAAKPPNLLELWMMGGPIMIPITFMSFVVVVFAAERGLALRRRKVIPPALVASLNEVANQSGGFDPDQAYKLCQQYPSAAANVVRAVLLKLGRPAAELEHAAKEASEREATRLYRNVRPINLATTVTPLLGLLGTVQGMIECFYKTANLGASANVRQELANGIYVALVTTFGGLVVAIPAAVLAHFFEGRIQAHFYEIDELLLTLLPRLEPFEGKIRLSQHGPS